ncbi:MAG: ferredoxin [Flavobacteriales bacterium]|nr:ferredoxin [Flavobacteriales bacterium]|tara:strand:+ start:1478 stop:1792 length:315 start_codon:yes stop_codon:yes gene_type:complete
MAIKITEDCINCEACEPECPNNAIYPPEQSWRFSDGTTMQDDKERTDQMSEEFFYIATDKCTECIGFHDEPQCAAVCPVDCCVDDEDNVESEEELMEKKNKLHA